MSLGQRMRQLREEREQTREQLADSLGVSYWALAKWETDDRCPDHETLVRLSEHFGVSVDWLLGHGTRHTPSTSVPAQTIPILGRIKAGIPLLSEANYEGEIEVPKDIKADFALRVSGDSMSWSGIADGDIAILKQVASPTHGAVVAAVEEGSWEATLKFYAKSNGHSVLKAANPEYSDIPITEKHKIIGQVVSLSKNPPSINDYTAHLMFKNLSDQKWQLAVELATQAGLDGENVAELINMFAKSVKAIKKTPL